MWVEVLTFFQQKISAYLRITDVNFNKSLTNDIVSFEQLGLGDYILKYYFFLKNKIWQMQFVSCWRH